MHKKIMREIYEPYEQWKKLQAEKELGKMSADGKEMQSGAGAEKPYFQDTIEAAGKQWSKQNTLAELNQLNQYLWDNYDERLGHDEYCKLVAWMHEKEELGERPTKEKESQEPQKEEKQWDTIEAVGKKWTKKNTLAELKDLDKYLWKNFDERIEKDQYKKLVAWMHEKEEFGEPVLEPEPVNKEPVNKEPGKEGELEKKETKDKKEEKRKMKKRNSQVMVLLPPLKNQKTTSTFFTYCNKNSLVPTTTTTNTLTTTRTTNTTTTTRPLPGYSR